MTLRGGALPGTRGTHPPWWRGARGEWLVALQIVLMAAVFFGPRTLPGLPAWPAPLERVARLAGGALMIAGLGLFLAGIFELGRGLTPLPYPKADADLVQTGPYRLVRHPMYSGGMALAFGWALFTRGWLTLAFATLLLILLDRKSAREERWLAERHPEYGDYQRRVRKLIPFLY